MLNILSELRPRRTVLGLRSDPEQDVAAPRTLAKTYGKKTIERPQIWINVTNGILGGHVSVVLSFFGHILKTEILKACTTGLYFQSCRHRPLGLSQLGSNKSVNCKNRPKYEIDKQTNKNQ